MGKNLVATFSIVEAERAPSFYAGCVRCGNILDQGEWAVVVGINGKYFIVGQTPLMQCCGADVNIPFLFRHKLDARDKMVEVMEKIRQDEGKFTGFSFFVVESFVPERIH